MRPTRFPRVRRDQWQRTLMRRPDVDEMDGYPVDLGHELRQRVQLPFARALVVLVGPVAGGYLDRGQLHAWQPVGDEFPGGPACRGDAPPKVSASTCPLARWPIGPH
jgi:hypothetical protein